MDRKFYQDLADLGLKQELIDRNIAQTILTSPEIELFPLLNAAYEVRKNFVGKEVMIHIINNGQNGFCPEDCHYCAQAKSSKADIEEYPIKTDAEFMAEAKNAYEKGAHRYCMVFAGRGPSQKRTEHLARLIREIKSKYPIEICVSAGLLNDEKAQTLKDAGLDRLNHNLNTSRDNYPNICTTHTYQDRITTLNAGRKAGIQLCSGLIIGMNETVKDILDVVYELRSLKVESIPVNMLIPIEGTVLGNQTTLTPDFCLRTLALFRFLNPKAELRVAAGRELNLRQMEVLALYPANSLFLDGYLNTQGENRLKTLQMIKDAGFTIKSEHSLEDVIGNEAQNIQHAKIDNALKVQLKGLKELRPHCSSH